ncbi:hypothetical protein [Aquimarina sp. 433]
MKATNYIILIIAILLSSMTSCEKETEIQDETALIPILDEEYREVLLTTDKITMPYNGKTYPALEVLQDEELFEIFKNAYGTVVQDIDDKEKSDIVLFSEDEMEDDGRSKKSKREITEWIANEMLKRTGGTSRAPNKGVAMLAGFVDTYGNGGIYAHWATTAKLWKGTQKNYAKNVLPLSTNKISSLTLWGQVGRESGSVRFTMFKGQNQSQGTREYWIDSGNPNVNGYQIYREVGTLGGGFNDNIESTRIIMYAGN